MGLIMGTKDDQRRNRRKRRGRWSLWESVHNAPKTVVEQPLHVEVDKQSYFTTGETQIRQKLCGVDALKSLKGLDFNDDFARHEKVDAISTIQGLMTVDKGQGLLSLDAKRTAHEFAGKARLVRGFEHAWAEFAMNVDCGRDDLFRDGVQASCL
jgi:hypothetical protein